MKRVYIITGAAGHLAGTIIQYLRKTECEIRRLILPSENGESDSQITYYKGDITKPESLEEIFSGLSGALNGGLSLLTMCFPKTTAHSMICASVFRSIPLSLFPFLFRTSTKMAAAPSLKPGVLKALMSKPAHWCLKTDYGFPPGTLFR